MASHVYPSDLADAEWAVLAALLPPAKPGGRPCSVDLRRIVNGLFSLVRSGCAWRYLPRDYGPWSTVYHYFSAISPHRHSSAARWHLRECRGDLYHRNVHAT